MASSALLSLFNFRRRTFATAQSCCLQRARPSTMPFSSLKDGTTCSGSARLPGSSVLLLCSQTPVPTKGEISRLQRAAVLRFSRSVLSDSAAPWTAAHHVPLSLTVSRSLLKLTSIESVMLTFRFSKAHLTCIAQIFLGSPFQQLLSEESLGQRCK